MSQICILKFIVSKIMGQAQINVRTRACSRTSIARTRQAALTHNVRGKELNIHISLAARGGNLAKIPPNQVIADFGRGSSVESESE